MNIMQLRRAAKRIPILLLLLTLVLAQSVFAAAGDLDTTFGEGGIADPGFGGLSYSTAVTIQPDGKIVAVGAASAGTCGGFGLSFAVSRLNADGTPDNTFGAGGKVATSFGGGDWAKAVLIQPDGNIVVAGTVQYCTDTAFLNTYAIALTRYNSNGTLDASFGNAGQVIVDMSAGNSVYQEVNAVGLQVDGKIVVAGFVNNAGLELGGAWWLARYNPNGTLDDTFGNGGIVRTTFVQTWDEHAQALLIQPDGKIVVAGDSVMYGAYFYLLLARYNADGALDSTFGQSGKTIGERSDWSPVGFGLARQLNGKLIVSTYLNDRASNVIARYNSDGSIDTSFGSNGWATIGLGGVRGMAVQPDGRIVAVGWSGPAAYPNPNAGVALVRLTPNGSLDTAFGADSTVVGHYADTATGIAIQSDSKIVVSAGLDWGGFTVARYLSPSYLFLPSVSRDLP